MHATHIHALRLIGMWVLKITSNRYVLAETSNILAQTPLASGKLPLGLLGLNWDIFRLSLSMIRRTPCLHS